MLEHSDVSPRPPSQVDQSAADALERLHALPLAERLEVLRAVTPRVLARVQEADRERLLALARGEVPGSAEPDEGGALGPGTVDRTIDALLDEPLEVQLHVLRLALPHTARQATEEERAAFVGDLERAIWGEPH